MTVAVAEVERRGLASWVAPVSSLCINILLTLYILHTSKLPTQAERRGRFDSGLKARLRVSMLKKISTYSLEADSMNS